MIVSELAQQLIELYSEKYLGRKLTLDELRILMLYNKNKMDYARNKYYREMNEIIENAVKQIGGILK